jgi:amino acid transporter
MTTASDRPVDSPARLPPVLGRWAATAVVVGGVIGTGIFRKPQLVAQQVPYSMLALSVWAVGGLVVVLGILSLGEVSVLFPRAGGLYVFLREGYGRMVAFLFAWVQLWVIRPGAVAALATMFTESFRNFIHLASMGSLPGIPAGPLRDDDWLWVGITVAVIMGLGLLNVLGGDLVSRFQIGLAAVKVLSLVALALLPFVGLVLLGRPRGFGEPRFAHLAPLLPATLGAVSVGNLGTALLGVLWTYSGWAALTYVAEEVHDPGRNLRFAFTAGVAIIIALYLAVALAYNLVLPQAEMAALKRTDVATAFCMRLTGSAGAVAVSLIILISVFGALSTDLFTSPRALFALGRDGLAPRAIGLVHPRFRTPSTAILVASVWASVLLVSAAVLGRVRLPALHLFSARLDLNLREGKALFDVMTDIASCSGIAFEALAVSTIYVFRRTLPGAPRPVRCWGYPIVPALYLAAMLFVLVSTFLYQPVEALLGLGFVALGAVVYVVMVRAPETHETPRPGGPRPVDTAAGHTAEVRGPDG